MTIIGDYMKNKTKAMSINAVHSATDPRWDGLAMMRIYDSVMALSRSAQQRPASNPNAVATAIADGIVKVMLSAMAKLWNLQ